jgi:hypothetical protein
MCRLPTAIHAHQINKALMLKHAMAIRIISQRSATKDAAL